MTAIEWRNARVDITPDVAKFWTTDCTPWALVGAVP
jgi:hypothetical protein